MRISEDKKKEIRLMASSGVMRKTIAKRTGLSERSIGRICEGIDKPEFRGSKSKPKLYKSFSFREDYDW